jgi:hypothetical protein
VARTFFNSATWTLSIGPTSVNTTSPSAGMEMVAVSRNEVVGQG